MEEVRSFGYLCPKCGKAVLGSRSVFALQAAAVRIGCACGESELEIQTDGTKFRLWVPCGLCGGEHHAEVDAASAGRTSMKTRRFQSALTRTASAFSSPRLLSLPCFWH